MRTGICDGDEATSDFFLADDLGDAIEEVLLENVGFQSRTGLAGYDKQCAPKIDVFRHGLDLSGIRRVEDAKLGEALDLSEGTPEYVGAETGASHSQ